jgi:hypothetical protein
MHGCRSVQIARCSLHVPTLTCPIEGGGFQSTRVQVTTSKLKQSDWRRSCRVFRFCPETYSVFSEPCVCVSGRLRETWRQWRRVSSRSGRRDAGASQGRLDAPGREHKAPVGRTLSKDLGDGNRSRCTAAVCRPSTLPFVVYAATW